MKKRVVPLRELLVNLIREIDEGRLARDAAIVAHHVADLRSRYAVCGIMFSRCGNALSFIIDDGKNVLDNVFYTDEEDEQ